MIGRSVRRRGTSAELRVLVVLWSPRRARDRGGRLTIAWILVGQRRELSARSLSAQNAADDGALAAGVGGLAAAALLPKPPVHCAKKPCVRGEHLKGGHRVGVHLPIQGLERWTSQSSAIVRRVSPCVRTRTILLRERLVHSPPSALCAPSRSALGL